MTASVDYFPLQLAVRRERSGLTLQQLSETTGMTLDTISRLERGIRKDKGPSLRAALRLAQALDCSLDDLVAPVRVKFVPRGRGRPRKNSARKSKNNLDNFAPSV